MIHYLIEMPYALSGLVLRQGCQLSKFNVFTGEDLSLTIGEVRDFVLALKPGAFLSPGNILPSVEAAFSREAEQGNHKWVFLTFPEDSLHPNRQDEVARLIVELANEPDVSVVLFTHSLSIVTFVKLAAWAAVLSERSTEEEKKIDSIIPCSLWLNKGSYGGWDVHGGGYHYHDLAESPICLPFLPSLQYRQRLLGALVSVEIEIEEKEKGVNCPVCHKPRDQD